MSVRSRRLIVRAIAGAWLVLVAFLAGERFLRVQHHRAILAAEHLTDSRLHQHGPGEERFGRVGAFGVRREEAFPGIVIGVTHDG